MLNDLTQDDFTALLSVGTEFYCMFLPGVLYCVHVVSVFPDEDRESGELRGGNVK